MSSLRAYFDQRAPTWDSAQPPDRDERLWALLAPFARELAAARAILEIGTGTGALIPLLAERAPAARLTSVDLAHAMLLHARARRPGAWLVEADVHRLPFAAGRSFDLAICHNSFPHFADRRAALAELRRVLRPAGSLLILHNLGRERVNAIHRAAGGPIAHDWLPPGDELARLLAETGWRDIQVEDAPERYTARAARS